MKKIIFFAPLIIALIICTLITARLGLSSLDILPIGDAFLCFLVSGVLLSYSKAWGGIFSIVVSVIVIYNGTNNWKLGLLETGVGVILLAFYIACSIAVYLSNRKC